MSDVRAAAAGADCDRAADAVSDADPLALAAADADPGADADAETAVHRRQYDQLHADGHADGHADADADAKTAVHQRQHPELHPDGRPDDRADAVADADAVQQRQRQGRRERQLRDAVALAVALAAADDDPVADAETDRDSDSESVGHAAAGSRGMTGPGAALTIAIAGAAFGIAALAATTYANPAHRFRFRPLAATLVAASVGAFGASRALTPEQLAACALVTCAFAIAFTCAQRGIGSRAFIAVAVALAVVAFAIALDGLWLPLVAGIVASLPFGLTALMTKHRERPLFDAMLAALAGLTLGFVSAYLVLFVACLTAVGFGKIRRVALADIEFAPAISAFGAAGLLINVSLQT